MNEQPFFSIIIPTYNRAHFLPNTINSVLQQTYTDYEIIVIDDGSTDNTKEVMESIASASIIYKYKKNEERGKARNTGMNMARGIYITFLDSDDLLYPNHLERAKEMLEKFKLPNFYRQAYEVKDETGKVLSKKNKVKGDANRFILRGNYFSCIGIFLKKEITEEIQFSNDRHLVPSEDWEYWLRLSARHKIFYDNTITACMINHKERSMYKFNEKMNRLVITKLIHKLRTDTQFMAAHGAHLYHIKAQMITLLCLNKVMTGENGGIAKDMYKSFQLSFKELFRKRTLVILKFYIQNLLKAKNVRHSGIHS